VGSVSVEGFMPEQVRAIYRRSCQSCHGLDGRGIVGVAPDLKRVRYRGAAEWERYLRNPQSAHPVSRVPPVWLDDNEIKVMAEYLFMLTQ
jgi:mono/diheme cytochrome c family protein